MQRINGEAGQDTDMIHGVVPEGNDFSDTIFRSEGSQELALSFRPSESFLKQRFSV